MSYRAGTQGMDAIGIPSGEPRLICDDCGEKRPVTNAHGRPFAWLLDRRAAPGWSMKTIGDNRADWCNPCTKKRKASPCE